MELHWILLFVTVIIVGLFAWHSSQGSLKTLRKKFEKSSSRNAQDELLGTHEENKASFEEPLAEILSEARVVSQETAWKNKEVIGKSKEELFPDGLVILNLKAQASQVFAGPNLMATLNRLELHLGDWDIFHYRNDETYFSLASAYEPGYFKKDQMENFHTNGLTLFMQLSDQEDARKSFETMLEKARKITDRLGGIVCDMEWKPLTQPHIQNYLDKL